MKHADIGHLRIRKRALGFGLFCAVAVVGLLHMSLQVDFADATVAAPGLHAQQAEVSPASRIGWVTGQVTDAVSDLLIARAQIEVQARVIDQVPDGTLRLRSLDEIVPLGIAVQTDHEGGFRVEVALGNEPTCFMVTARADGYQELWNVLVPVRANQSSRVDFPLIKVDLTPQELEILDQKHEREKTLLYQENPSFQQAFDVKQWVNPGYRPPVVGKGEPLLEIQQTYPVPESVYVVNLAGFTGYMGFDEYIAGVVSLEMGDGFPFEALKMQAVAARTYALERYNRTGVANGGQAYTSRLGSKSQTAAINTSQIVMLYDGRVIVAFYSARCNGDFTLNGENGLSGINTCIVSGLGAGGLPYLRSRPCSGHINCSQTSERCCNVSVEGRWQYIYGHGVGMCQRGAQQFAGRDGLDWQEILHRYYTDVTLVNLPGLTINDAVITTTNLNVRDMPCGHVLVTIPGGTPGSIVGGPQRPSCALASPYSFLTWWEVLYADGTRGWSVEDYLRKMSAP